MSGTLPRAIAAIALFAGALWFVITGPRVLGNPEDLRAFYCGGRAVLAHRDPYLAEPIRTCEVRLTEAAGLTPYRRLAVPAPLPGYGFAPFALLARLPFEIATSLYVVAVTASLFGSVFALRGLVPVSPLFVLAALGFSGGVFSLLHGQIVPLVVFAVCACALEVRRGRFRRAAAYATLAAIEPHIAAPIWLALAIALPRMRLPLVVGGLGLAVLAIATIGLPANLEYVARVLPAHARSEAAAGNQYSLTTLLVLSGTSRDLAIALGDASYAFMLVAGITVARMLARSLAAPEFLVVMPAAFVLLGGPYIHLTQMALAVPALVVLLLRAPAFETPTSIALVLVAIPWAEIVDASLAGTLGVALVAASGIVAFAPRRAIVRGAIVVTISAALAFCERALHLAHPHPFVDAGPAIARVDGDARLAEATWAAFNDAARTHEPWAYVAICLPTWIGIALAIGTALAAARTPAEAATLNAQPG